MRAEALLLAILLAGLGGCSDGGSRPSEPSAQTLPAAAEPGGVTSAQPLLNYNAREGRALFQHYCATCHGSEGGGDGFNAYNLDPKPRDLAEAAFQKRSTDEELAEVIRTGGGAAGLSTGMPPWGRTLNERQIRNLVIFLRTLPVLDPNPSAAQEAP